MSTFDGLVAEFPEIRIDFFRRHADASPPLACFLSHVHSDHLAGLESLRSPFVYCSAATREILLRLERYPCRINYAKGVLEARQQTYRHLGRVLKPLPLETPTTIELRPGYRIRVTLFDANHCPGAVMFLIEGGGKSILYTGDIRSEPWFVDGLARNPTLIEYTYDLKTLDKIYLDTSFTADVHFQTKSQGIAELLRTVSRYPRDTIFHFQAWTYGYEDVWIALSKALDSPVHVDDYKLHVYGALRSRAVENRPSTESHLAAGAAALTGHMCGNTPHPGCLTSDPTVRLHSCEKGNMCAVASGPGVVTIQPIIARLPSGKQLAEAGVGGGGEDLEREAELTCLFDGDAVALAELISACDSMADGDRIAEAIRDASSRGRGLSLNLAASTFGEGLSADLETALGALFRLSSGPPLETETPGVSAKEDLPTVIHFPYSRHSSYAELCHLLGIFRPRDIWPCTVDMRQWVDQGISIESLFGHFSSGQVFAHDLRMADLATAVADGRVSQASESQVTGSWPRKNVSLVGHDSSLEAPPSPLCQPRHDQQRQGEVSEADASMGGCESRPGAGAALDRDGKKQHDGARRTRKRKHDEQPAAGEGSGDANASDSQQTEDSLISTLSARPSVTRSDAYYRMLGNAADGGCRPISLLCTDGHHSKPDEEL